MRAAVVAAALIGVVLALRAGRVEADGAPPAATRDGFDHYLHDRDVDVTGADPIPCTACHRLEHGLVVGKPRHAACFGKCHGPVPTRLAKGKAITVEPERALVCFACHSPASLAASAPTSAALVPTYPPYTLFQDFALVAGHRTHSVIACTSCHPRVPGGATAKPGAPHARCAKCHDGSGVAGRGPAMTACETCHTRASGTPEPLAMRHTKADQIFVSKTFSHAKHAARGGGGAQCLSCHAEVTASDDRQLPRPLMKSCGASGCHDGVKAFSVYGPCRQCHAEAPTDLYEVARPTARFEHASPTHLAAGLACGACHALSPRGEPLPPTHATCATEGCHANDFSARVPTTCGACHNGTEPWRPLVVDRAPRARSELGILIDHVKHPGACARCHVAQPPRGELRTAVGHTGCTGTGCHAQTAGPAPTLATCEGCHRAGLADARLAARLAATWSVRATFAHGIHATTRDGFAVPCRQCHTDLRADSPLTLPTPAKATCAGCHDGGVAFKLTGTTCTRCHAGTTPSAR